MAKSPVGLIAAVVAAGALLWALTAGGIFSAPMGRTSLAITAALVTLPKSAQVPNYDPASYCVGFAKGHQILESECRRNEAYASRKLKSTKFRRRIWRYCKDLMQSEQSYSLLYGCALREANARARQRPEVQLDAGQ